MTVYNVFGASAKHNTMADTWGHLYPEPKSKHTGTIFVSHGDVGGTTILDYSFPSLSDSPQTAVVIGQVLDLYDWEAGSQGLFRVDCTLWFFKNCQDLYLESRPIGKIIKPNLTTLGIF